MEIKRGAENGSARGACNPHKILPVVVVLFFFYASLLLPDVYFL